MYRNFNINPLHKRADDCTIRAIATVLDKPWEEVYAEEVQADVIQEWKTMKDILKTE